MSITRSVTRNVTRGVTWSLDSPGGWGELAPTIYQNFQLANATTLADAALIGPTLSLTRASANATRFNDLGLIEVVTTNEPRFNWTPNTQLETGWEVDLSGFASVGDGTGAGTREAVAARTGGFGAQLLTDSTSGDFVRLTNSSFAQPTGRVVTDVWFYVVGSNDAGFEVATEGWTGAKRHLTSIRWIDDTGFTERFQYWNRDTDNWSAVPGTAMTLSRDAWHHLQVVIDWETLEYIEMILDDTSYPMTGIPIENVDDAASAFMQVSLFAWTYSSNPLTIYMDDFRLAYPSPDGLLVEEARTNAALQSADLSTTWGGAGTVTVNDIVGPDGGQTGDKWVTTLATDERNQNMSSTFNASDPIVISHYAKVTEGSTSNKFRLGIWQNSGEDLSADLTSTEKWARYSYALTAAADAAQWYNLQSPTTGASTNWYWGADAQLGAFITSHIPTTTTTQTRAADVTSATVTSYLGAANTLYVSARTGADQDCVLLQIDDGTENERYRIARVSGAIHVITTDGGSDVADLNLGAVADDTDFTVAARFALNNFAASLDGAAVVTDAAGTLPTITTLRVGMDTSGDEWNGTIAAIKLWSEAKTDSFLMAQ